MPAIGIRKSDSHPTSKISGDEMDWLETSMRREVGPLVSYLCRVVNNRVSAEELAQNVFLHVRRVPERWLSDADVTVRLYRAATVLALRNGRRQRTRKEGCEGGCDVPGQQLPQAARTTEWISGGQESSRQQHRDMIASAIATLPEKERIAFLLHKYQGIHHRQIAKILRLPETGVRSLLFRAYTSLCDRLQPVIAG